MQNNKAQNNKPVFLNYVAAGYPFLWVQTHEEFRAMTTFAQELSMDSEPHTLFSWDSVDGVKLRQFEEGILKSAVPEDLDDKGLEDPLMTLTWASSLVKDDGMEDNSILFLQDFHHSIKKPEIVRKIRNILPYFKATGKVLVVISHSMDLPPDLEKEITPIQFKLPTIKELDITLKGICLAADEMAKAMKKELYPKNALPVLEAALGMTALEAEAAFALSLREKQCFDIEVINREKAAIVKKTGLLEVVEVKETLADVGGLENMKTWLKARENCFTEEARKFGIRPPKGLLLGGLPGTGKSLSAKCTATLMKRPLLRLDLGKVFGSYVGESESNIRKCLDIADAVAPCLTGDTKILLADGREVTIKSLYNKHPHGGFKVISYDMDRAELIPSNVLKVTKKITTDCYQMKYSDGEAIGYSWNHPQPVMRDGKISWINTEDVQIGDYVAVPMGDLEIAPIDFMNYLPSGCLYYKKYTDKKNKIRSSYSEASVIACGKGGYTDSLLYKWPEKIKNQLFYLLGLLVSDGSIGKSRISFTNSQRILIDQFKDAVYNLFGIDCKEIYIDAKTARERGKNLKQLKNSDFSEFWVVHFNSKIISHVLHKIMEHIRGFDTWKIKSFLSGYIDGDGCILPSSYPRIIFCAHKKKERYLLKSLLKRINILPSAGTDKDVTVSGSQTELLKNLSLIHPEKRKKLESIRIPEKRDDRVVVFPIGRLITTMRENLGRPSYGFKTAVSSEIHSWEHNKRPIPKNRLQLLINELRVDGHLEWAEKFNSILQTPLRWLKVVSKKEIGKKEVYDLCCETYHNFLANGILTHNCVLWIDELEKSFTNTKGGSGNSKGGEVSMRVYSTFLTWLQEKTSDVFIVATANDVESIDAALLRRLDVVFWVDLPDDKQRKEIIEIHLRKAGRDPKNFSTQKLAEDCDKFSGSEIETWIRDEALPYAFQHGHELCDEDLLKVRPGIVPQAIMMAEDIARYRKWAEEHKVRPASKQAKKVEIPVPTKRKISLGTPSPGAAN